MAAQYKTKCPHCGSQFRISQEHLKQANGAVRCGSCLKVFQATENLVREAPAKAPARAPAKAPAKATPKPAAAKPETPKAAPPESWSLPDDKPAAPEKPASRWTLDEAPASEDSSSLDKDFDDDAVTREEYKGNDTRVSLGSTELSDSLMNLGEDDDERLVEENFSDMAGAGRGGGDHDGDESWAEKLLEELEEPAARAPATADEMVMEASEEELAEKRESEEKRRRKKEKLSQAAPAGDDIADWADEADDFFSGFDDDGGSAGLDTDGGLSAIELPEVDQAPSRASIARPNINMPEVNMGEMIKWAALSLVALLVLGLQYLAFNFDELARTPQWRSLYATACGTLGCALPNPSNVDQLRGSNLVIRSHPQVTGALVVDVIVFNEAAYEQPFPLLELGFASLQGVPVASRRFAPDEYLHGELEGMTRMPRGVPVHISFEIMDPGPDAVNYTLRFFPTASQGS